MFQEMDRTLNAIGDYSDTEEETDDEPDTQPPQSSGTPATAATNPAATEDGEPKKKKKKRKKKKVAKPDLEDLLSNAEALEPEDPFDLSKSVAERVELAVTRFRKRRNFSIERAQIFSSYLDYGGIRTGPKSFQGGAVKPAGMDDDDGEPDFEAMNAGIDSVDLPEDGQVVDFTNVVTTFLSQHFLKNTGWIDMLYYRDAPLVVAALLNYFLIRNVVPEHEDDVRAALAVAEQAKIELPLCKQISTGWPSRYDKACSLLYGGEWYGFLDSHWSSPQVQINALGMDMVTARKIIQSLVGPDVDPGTLTVSPREFMELEIIQVDLPKELEPLADDMSDGAESPSELPPEDEARIVAMVDRMFLSNSGQAESTVEMPVLPLTDSELEGPEQEDETPIPVPVFADVTFAQWDSDVPREEQKPIECRRKVHVYFDPSIATKMLRGMRVTAFVYTLSNGMSYLEQASVYPTYYLEADEVEEPLDEDEWDD
ncbi:hypothetical protein BGZ99_005466 [Dissophora globulifera]|uniref:Uncharacterized protein n=1 Tax=Dissophora globulifera TaxID=979702 RepID=A0A9P6UTM9_9FUNG|nr:hypothetical protein BGZ99_005466 [Dissophora globulifera]